MMGGLGVYTDSIHVNLRNPAAYSQLGLDQVENGRLAVYSGALTRKDLNLKTAADAERNAITNLEYLALGFNLKDGFGIGFGIMPYSSIGYTLLSESVNADGAEVINLYEGEGGLNRVYFSAAYEFFEDFSFGVTANFNFGELTNINTQTVENVQFGTRDEKISKVDGMDFNYALQYNPKIKEKHRLFASVRINTQANLSATNSRQLGSYLVSEAATIEAIDVNLEAEGLRRTDLRIPTTYTLGLGYGEEKKWFLGAEYSTQTWDNFSNEFLGIDNIRYQDANNISVGGFYIPDYDAFNGYFKRVTYRAGARFGSSGMIVNDVAINDFGITFGVGLPLGRSLPNINLGFEIGKRGTTEANLVEENYIKINLGFSFNDIWFLKRKIN